MTTLIRKQRVRPGVVAALHRFAQSSDPWIAARALTDLEEMELPLPGQPVDADDLQRPRPVVVGIVLDEKPLPPRFSPAAVVELFRRAEGGCKRSSELIERYRLAKPPSLRTLARAIRRARPFPPAKRRRS